MIDGNDFIGLVKKVAIYLVAALLLMLVSGLLGGIIGYGKGKAGCQSLPETDTIVVTRIDTVTLVGSRDTLTRIVWKPYPVAVHDTTWMVRHTTDSVWISLPYQYRYYGKPDTLDVWYSGIDPHVDSARVYMHHTTQIIKQPYEVYRMPRLTAELGAGAFYHESRVNPYALAKMSYNAPHVTFGAYGAVNHEGKWAAGLNVTYRLNILK